MTTKSPKSPKLRPLRGQILIRRAETSNRTEGGIWKPDTSIQNAKQYEGEVVAVGEGETSKDGKVIVPCSVKPGERVLFAIFQGQAVPDDLGGKDRLWLIKDSDCLAVVEG